MNEHLTSALTRPASFADIYEPLAGTFSVSLPIDSIALALFSEDLAAFSGSVQARSRESLQAERVADLNKRQARFETMSLKDILSRLSDTGLAWRDIARMAQVSVPAVRKWRIGEGASSESRARLARIAALLEWLGDNGISEPSSWIEMPVQEKILLSRLDMIAAGREDLVLELGPVAFEPNLEDILHRFDPEWRSAYVDDVFETIEGPDGDLMITLKQA